MTDLIESRIKAIKEGKLPEGYKRTKAGIMLWIGMVRFRPKNSLRNIRIKSTMETWKYWQLHKNEELCQEVKLELTFSVQMKV